MKYKNALYRADEARLLDAVRAIAVVTGWALVGSMGGGVRAKKAIRPISHNSDDRRSSP